MHGVDIVSFITFNFYYYTARIIIIFMPISAKTLRRIRRKIRDKVILKDKLFTRTPNTLLHESRNDQTVIGWESFQWGFLSEKWNACHELWILESKQKFKNFEWNHYAIPHIISYSTNIWKDRCQMTHLQQREPEHFFLLQQSDELLTQILTSPDIMMSEDLPRLQIQRTTLQKYDESELCIWKYSTEVSIRLKTFLTQNNSNDE